MIHYMSTTGVGNAWVGNELRGVGRAGIPYVLHSLAPPPQVFFSSEDIAQLNRDTRVIYPLPRVESLVAFLLAPFRFGGRFWAVLWNSLTGERESWRTRLVGIFHVYVACFWATRLRAEKVTMIHSQWIHSGGTVAMYGAWLLDVPFSFTGHAADLFRERAGLRDKIRRAEVIICISEFHRQFFLQNGARPEQLHIMYCGIDTTHFVPRPRMRKPGEPHHILSSGRLVEKKGFPWLVRACGVLRDRGVNFSCTIAGSGEQAEEIRAEIRSLGLEDRVVVTGKPLDQEDIPEFMHGGDIYCLPCVWASDNDVDGLPQMLMEAMACGLPAVSTRLVGIPDLILEEKTGLLVDPEQTEPLADALQRLINDPELAARLAHAGRERVLDAFDLSTCLEPLLRQYRARLGKP